MSKEIKELQPRKRKSCIFLLFDRGSGKVLMQRRHARSPNDKMAGMLIIPGGKVEEVDRVNGDYFEDALIREVFEEFGVVVTAKTALFEMTHTTPNGNTYDSRVYLVHGWQGNVRNVEEKHELLWLDIREAEDLVSNPVSKRAIRAAREWSHQAAIHV